MSVSAAIDKAKATLACAPLEEGPDPRWQAIIDLSEFLATDPEPIWGFIEEFHDTQDKDLQAALATCLLEHLIKEHPQYRERADGLSQQKAHTITGALVAFGVIQIVSKGDARPNGGKAGEFRYLLSPTENAAQEADEVDVQI